MLNTLLPVGILSRADIVLPNEFQALHANFPPERPVPTLIARLFELPIQISVPLYSLERVPANQQPLAYLVLQADSFRMYQFILSILSTMLSTYLLLALILSVAITWCMNRLMVHPLRAMAKELENISQDEAPYHQLMLPALHQDDELGLLVRNYNRNQQTLAKAHADMSRLSTRHPVTELPNPALLNALLEQHIASSLRPERFNLLVIGIETLHEASGVMSPAMREALLLALAKKLRGCIDENGAGAAEQYRIRHPGQGHRAAVPRHAAGAAHHGGDQRAVDAGGAGAAAQRQHRHRALPQSGESAEQLLRSATSAMMSAHREGKIRSCSSNPA